MNIRAMQFPVVVTLSLGWSIAASAAEIRIGIAGDLSGGVQWIGEQQEVGAQKAVADLNASGGVLGTRLSVVSVDDACEPEQAKAAARQLVSEGVVFVLGHVCSGASIAASEIYEAAGIIMMSSASTNPRFTDEGRANVFRVCGRDDQQGTVAGDFLADRYAGRNIAIIHDGQAYGAGLAEQTRRRLNERGVSERLFESYLPEQSDYTSIVNMLVEQKIDVLYGGGYNNDLALILRQARTLSPNLQLVSGDALASEDFLVVAGEAGKGTYFTFGPDMRIRPEAASVVASFRDSDGYEPQGYTLYSYGAVQAWAQAVQRAGSVEPAGVIAALKNGEFDTVLGRIGFDDKGDVTGISAYVWYVFDDETYAPVN